MAAKSSSPVLGALCQASHKSKDTEGKEDSAGPKVADTDRITADEVNKPLLKPDLLATVASKREAYKADYAKARVKDAAKFWEHLQHNNNRVDSKGWEDETQTTPMGEDVDDGGSQAWAARGQQSRRQAAAPLTSLWPRRG